MKIKINENVAKARKAQVLAEIIASAKDAAERGVDNFIYQFKVDERNSFLRYITTDVSKATDGHVKCMHKGDHGSWVKFVIV